MNSRSLLPRRLAALCTVGSLLLGGVAVAQPTGAPTPVTEAPPNGPGLGPTGTPVIAPDVNPIQLSAQDKEQLKDIEAEYDRFSVAANAHDQRMRTIARYEYDSRVGELTARYGDKVARTEAARIRWRTDTVARLEKFVVDYPAHPQFTPDAMFRLADLYIDVADDELEARLTFAEASGQPLGEGEMMADYSRSTKLWEDLLTRFPTYRQTPSTMYLLAYYGQASNERKSLQIFLALACANQHKWNDPPKPPPTRAEALKRIDSKTLTDPFATCTPHPGADPELIRHAWVRGIADYHFAVPGEIDEAIAAYLKVADGGNDSKLYSEALYKLAWSYYKRDYLFDSIKRFDESVRLYDALVAGGGQPALELRDESIQYISVAFTDPWNGETNSDPQKAFDRAKDFYRGRENEPHVRDVWVALGKAFSDLQAWDQAIDAYRVALGPPWELNSRNPEVHQEIVNVFELKGDKFAADGAAAELATRYVPGTAWYTANEKDREAMETQRRIAERALYAATRNTHAAATEMRKEWEAGGMQDAALRADYLATYGKAVELYRVFIQTYPESDYAYEFTFMQGEALYWSERYPEAILAYTWVREHRDLGTTYYLDAARSILQSYEADAQKQVAEGKVQPLKVPTIAELKALPQPWTPQPIPEIYVKLQAEYDNFQNVVPDPKAAPGQGINAALISLAYLHTDDAIARFGKVMDKFCGAPEAAKAKDGILAVYEAQGKFDALEATNKRFIRQKCGDDKAIQLAVSQNRALNFSRAGELYGQKQYAQAAEAFYRFYKTAPATDPDLPTALYNTAVSYKLADKPKTAIAMFKEFTANPAKNFRQSPYYLDAMRLTAASYQAAFDYDSAVKTYLEVVKTTQDATRLGIKAPDPLPGEQPKTLEQIGLDALYNAALAAELDRDFKQAIELYGRYGKAEPDRRKKDRAVWSIASIYRQSGDVTAMATTYDGWRRVFGKDAGNEDDYVQTFYDVAALRKRKNQMDLALAAGKDAIDAWQQRGAVKNSRGAKLAGEWSLALAEEHFAKTWEPFAVKTAAKTVAEAKAQNAALEKAKVTAEDKYLALDPYGVAEYSMAAKVRYGDIQYGFAQKIGDAPIPVPVAKNEDAVAAYESQRDKNLTKYLNEAKGQWTEVLELAKRSGISNPWSRLAQENLGREFPKEFTVLRQEIIQGTEAP